ncbi:hypothetical protein [Nostoc sp.]|uniref:hypothetical protein n=1 Tax=Nostoc sp. TaxID=1180 RepID=UPI00359370DA
MKQKKAIVTLLIGQHYQQRWKTICAKNWQQYADKHDYDLVCIDKPLDTSAMAHSRSPAWQKCLILGDERVKGYDKVVWIDSDILINPNSPCIVSNVTEDKVGAVSAFAQFAEPLPGKDQMLIDRIIEFWNWPYRNAKEFYSGALLPDSFDQVVQTGVMVLSPHIHNSILEYTYHHYDETPLNNFEMDALSYELLKANCIHWLDDKFNKIWLACMAMDYPLLLPPKKTEIKPIRFWKRLTRGHYQLPPKKVTTPALNIAFLNNYFLHFAGTSQYMPWVNTNITSWNDI